MFLEYQEQLRLRSTAPDRNTISFADVNLHRIKGFQSLILYLLYHLFTFLKNHTSGWPMHHAYACWKNQKPFFYRACKPLFRQKESILVSSKGIRKQTIGCEYLQRMHFLRRWSSRRFPYGYLVTTLPQSWITPWWPSSEVRLATSGATHSHGMTGGVYKTRERIHRSILIYDY